MNYAHVCLSMAFQSKIYQSEYPYHIYNRTNNREYLFDLALAFPIFMDCLKVISERTDFRLHHFILMNNHYHLIGSTPRANLFEFMRTFQTTVSQAINKHTDRINHIFGNRYGATVIMSEYYLAQVIRYIYQNPVRADITGNPFSYPYSTLKYYRSSEWSTHGLFLDPYLKDFSEKNRIQHLEELCVVNLDEKAYHFLKKKLKRKFF